MNGPSNKDREAVARSVDQEIQLINSFTRDDETLARNEMGNRKGKNCAS